MEGKIAVKTKSLCKEFDGKTILNRIEITVREGEIYGILGANGAGKTTLLKLIGGLLEPTEGGAYVMGKNVWEERNSVLGQIGSIIEVPAFYEHLNAYENLSIHLSYMGVSGDIKKTLEAVGLGEAMKKPISKFSLGMRQRLGIARSIIHKPRVLLLDEPINGLDPVAIREMRELFLSLKNQGISLLLSSHILSEVEQTAERVAVIARGSLVLEENMEELRALHKDRIEDYLITKMSGGKVYDEAN